MKLQYIVRKYVSEVELWKDNHCPLGISISGGSQKDRCRPTITSIKHGSVAHGSHCLAEGDVIVSLGGRDTKGMTKKEAKRYFKDVNPRRLDMIVEYVTEEACFGYCRVYSAQRMLLRLRKENGTYGFVLRKSSGAMQYPFISNIKRNGPADREGVLMAGDRVLEVDNQSLSWMSLTEASSLLQSKTEAAFLIEYNAGILDLCEGKEIYLDINCPDIDLGMTVDEKDFKMVISTIQQGSLAQRCGAFHAGDEILAINDVDIKSLTSSKANDLLRRFRKSPTRLIFVHKGEQPKPVTEPTDVNMPMSQCSSSFFAVPHNSLNSSYYEPIPEDVFFLSGGNLDNFQLDLMSDLKSINNLVEGIYSTLLSENSNIISNIGSSQSNFSNSRNQNTLDVHRLDDKNVESIAFKEQVLMLRWQIRTLIIQVIKNAFQISSNCNNSKMLQTASRVVTVSSNFITEFIDSLNEMANQRLISKNSTKSLQASIVAINKNCHVCIRELYAASFVFRKVLLLLSLNSTTQEEIDTIRLVLKRVSQLSVPCDECKNISYSGSNYDSQNVNSNQKADHCLAVKRTFGVGASITSASTVKSFHADSSSSRISRQNSEACINLHASKETVVYKSPTEKSNENGRLKIVGSESNSFTKKRIAPKTSTVRNSNSSEYSFSGKTIFSQSSIKEQASSSAYLRRRTSSKLYYREKFSSLVNAQKENVSQSYLTEDDSSFERQQEGISSQVSMKEELSSFECSPSLQTSMREGSILSECSHRRTSQTLTNEVFIPNECSMPFTENYVEPQCKPGTSRIQNQPEERNYSSNGCSSLNICDPKVSDGKFSFQPKNTDTNPHHDCKKHLCHSKSSQGFVPTNPKRTVRSSDDQLQENYRCPQAQTFGDSSTDCLNPSDKCSKNIQTHPDVHEVSLKADNGSFGFIFGYNSLSVDNENRVPFIAAIKPKSAAHKNGLLKKGDRILALNGFGTVGISLPELESLKRDIFNLDEVVLTVEFDVTETDVIWGTFDVELETAVKLGLVMDEPRNPSFVRALVKGSSAHRSGKLFPGDEILSFSTLQEDNLNLQTWTTRKTKVYHLTVKRELDNDLSKKKTNSTQYPDAPFDPVSFVRSGSHFNIKRTSIRTLEGSVGGKEKMILEQEFTLFRDPLTWDFGFMFGENPQTGNAYITDIRPNGPADNSKIIRKYDRIIEVNGTPVDNKAENSIMALLMQTEDSVNLLTRRVIHYR